MNNRGFSAIELLASLAIAGILTGLAAFQFSHQSEHTRLSHASRSLMSDLRWARQMAISRTEEVRLVLDATTDRYWIERASRPGVVAGAVRDFKDGRQGYGGIDLVSSSNGETIRFFPKGTTNTWTTIALRNNDGEEKQITLLATGRVRLYEKEADK